MDPKNPSSRPMRAKLGGALVPFAAFTMLASCSQAHDARENDATASEAIVSNRPQTDTHFTAIIRLSTPPLLRASRDATGHVAVDPWAKTVLLGEQQRFLDALHALSPDIRVLFTYRLTFNGFAIVAPIALKAKFAHLPGVVSLEQEQTFERPVPEAAETAAAGAPGPFDTNSVRFIGGDEAHAAGITGKGIVVGVIDTGVDYTHAMFGGAGTPEAFTANDPNKIEDGTFPTAKVIGGIDLVGTAYDAASIHEDTRLPIPDADPLDEAGHGSHVSGTIAGHGNGVDTYDGVAPDAKIFAIKIFGASGSVGDSVIMAALEKAADPNGDLDTADRLDVVNLSLGGNFGTRYALYDEVIGNLTWGGTATICAAGNAGPTPYVVSAPSTADAAISVAASIDDASWNWRFDAVSFKTSAADLLVKAYEATFTTPIAKAAGVGGKLVPVGLAAVDLTPAQAAAVAGNVALIDRGAVTFYDKVKRAYAAGAVGVVIANNRPGDPNAMSGTGPIIPIPAIMVTQDMGNQFKADIAAAKAVTITFFTDKKIEAPEIVDSLASFSSRGPRSLDGIIKPEVAAPGYQVVSAAMGSGSKGVKFSGTSMATPHITGVVALLRQAIPAISTTDIKARMMATGSPVHDAKYAPLPVSEQGAGRVHIMDAIKTAVVIDPPALSLGWISASEPTSTTRMIWLKNTGADWQRATITADAKPGLTVTTPKHDVWVPPYGYAPAVIKVDVDLSTTSTAFVTELDDVIRVSVRGSRDARATSLVVPVLAEARRGAEVTLAQADTTSGAMALSLANPGPLAGEAVPFNLIGLQRRGAAKKVGPCALASAGYRVTNGTIEVGVRLAHPLSGWNLCEVSMLVDANGDGVPEQELAGSSDATIKPASWGDSFGSFLIDAAKMRDVESKMELGTATAADTYLSAVEDVRPFTRFGFSQIGVVAADLTKLKTGADGMLRVKIGLLPSVEGTVGDEFLGAGPDGEWLVIDPKSAPFGALPASVPVTSAGSATFDVTPTAGASGALLLYMPDNDPRAGSSVVVRANGSFFVAR